MFEVRKLSEDEIEIVDELLDEHDKEFIKYKLDGDINIGVEKNGKLIAGLNACMTAFKIMYIMTLYVDKDYRQCGIGSKLMKEAELMAKEFGANTIRLDTFNFQGSEFYKKIGYTEVGHYSNDEDNFSESFFLKNI